MIKNVKAILVLCASITLTLWTIVGTAAPCAAGHCTRVNPQIQPICKEAAEQNGGVIPPIIIVPTELGGICTCPCSCFATDTKIEQGDGEGLVQDIERGASLMTPRGERKVQLELRSKVENAQAIQLELDNGRSLTVSTNHPFISYDGIITSAEKLKDGSELAGTRGEPVTVLRATPTTYSGWFHNFIVKSRDPKQMDRIVQSEGVQSGDWLVQSYHDQVKQNINIRDLLSGRSEK